MNNKRSRKRIAGTMCVQAALAVVIASLWMRGIPDPVYEGVTLGDRLDRGGIESFLEVQGAVKALGARAVPYLTNVLANEPTQGQRLYGMGLMKLPEFLKTHLPAPRDFRSRRIRAAGLLRHAGSNAVCAVPLLVEVATRDAVAGVRYNALGSLAALAPNTEFAPTAIETIIKATRSSGYEQEAFMLLGSFPNEPNLVVPTLLHGLRDRNTRESCLFALKQIGPGAMTVARRTVKVEGYLPVSLDDLEREISSAK